MLANFETVGIESHTAKPGFGHAATATLPREGFDLAQREIQSWSGYKRAPMPSFQGLAEALDLGAVYYKHEGLRFGLGSFKAIGGAYAVLRVLQRELTKKTGREVTADEIRNGTHTAGIADITVISATDGNHGRSVAWGAQRFGAPCRIYIHKEVSAFRADAMRQLGAEVIRVDGDYDASVAQTRTDAAAHGWLIVSDTSWPGYTQAPLDVMAGYGVMAREIVQDLALPPTHVFLQGGVGGLAAAVTAVFLQEWEQNAPRVIVVEPELAPCLFASAQANRPTAVEVGEETIMAGLSCGAPSELAWNVLEEAASGFMKIPDQLVAPAVRLLANGAFGDEPIEAGESAVAGLIGLICASLRTDLRQQYQITPQSRVMLIGSEGVTDPHVFDRIMNDSN